MNNLKGRKGYMAIKIDLEKAYNRLRWDFIKETLVSYHFPPAMIQIIMKCITTPTMQVLWNGEASRTFFPTRGIRQGDPLSSYIFVLCLEHLSQMINRVVFMKERVPIIAGRRGSLYPTFTLQMICCYLLKYP